MSNSERWKPGYNEDYYYVDSDLSVVTDCWYGESYMDTSHYDNYNCFKTREEAVAVAEKVKKLLESINEPVQPEKVEPLQKLTVEVFYRPDCPEWATVAVVNEDGTATWGSGDVRSCCGEWWAHASDAQWESIPGKFDASDWENSLIERPQKVTLPEWCKVGEWVYVHHSYHKITQIETDGCSVPVIILDNGNKYTFGSLSWDDVSQARLRPYLPDEMESLVGRVAHHATGSYLITAFENRWNQVKIESVWRDADELMKVWTWLEGVPCGKLVHKEGDDWVE